MRRLAPSIATVISIAVLAASCATTGSDPTEAPTTSAAPVDTTVPATAAPATSAAPLSTPPCLAGDRPFATSGIISAFGGSNGDAAQISAIRATSHEGCDRVVVDLLTVDGAPASSLGPVGVEYDESAGIVRINLPRTVTNTAVADSLFDGVLAERAFVVRTVAGHLAVDIHVVAGSSVALRAFEVNAPARVVVDLVADDEATPVTGATAGEGVVVITPTPGPATTPLVVSGYARTFEAHVEARLHDTSQGEPVAEDTTTATDWTEAWGEFTITLPDAPARSLELFVGSESPRDGSPLGVWMTVDLTSTEPVEPPEA
ncbi:MAG: Gmad2 immunoglobulin-like domain-containing protein [Actinomycetota bacterium]|nr:Gmad2 immunoglobulin-like domain-containing protein [Actinomycetota bacterium]